MTFGEKLLELRKKNGLSQEDLALKLGVSRQAISRWELGSVLPDVVNVVQLSELFDVSTDYLLKDEIVAFSSSQITNMESQTNKIDKEKNAMMGLIVVLTLHTLAFLLSLYGYIEQLEMAIFSGLPIHFVLFVSFEMAFAWYKKQGIKEVYPNLHVYYHIAAVWLITYFPIWLGVTIFFKTVVRAYYLVIPELITLVIYLVVCISVTKNLRKKLSSLV